MPTNGAPRAHGRRLPVILGVLLASLLLLTAVHSILAQGEDFAPVQTLDSAKIASHEFASPGSVVQYSIIVSNTGATPAEVEVTDKIAQGTEYIPGTLLASAPGEFSDGDGVINWMGVVPSSQQVVISFDAQISDALPAGSQIRNTAYVSNGKVVLSPTASTTIESGTSMSYYLPFLNRLPPTVVLDPIPRASAANEWTLMWTASDTSQVTGYRIEEDHSPSFSTPTVITVGVTNTLQRAHSASANNVYYYRVAALGDWHIPIWSNLRWAIGEYRDDMGNASTGWAMRRQDTDVTANQVYYRNGHLVLEMDSGWDYLLAAPMAPMPTPPYRLEARVRLVGVDNAHTYGLVFGGDWDGSPCPNGDYSSCFNHYYRLLVLWTGAPSGMRMQLKRIDFHSPTNNSGQGVELIPWQDITVNSPSEGYQTWAIEYLADGTIKVLVNGNLLGQANDTTFASYRYFGAFASVDEYTGLEAEFDYIKVDILP